MKFNHFKEKPFLSGYRLGIFSVRLSIQLQELRTKKKVSLEEVAKATGVSVDVIKGLEQAKLKTFLTLKNSTLSKLTDYYDATVDIRLVPTGESQHGDKDAAFPQYKDIDMSSKDRV